MAVGSQDALALEAEPMPHADAPLREWLAWLEAGRGEHVDLGLERCRAVAARLEPGRPAPLVVTVAGTNGKGSSVALLEGIWRRAGYRVGTYTSPHLKRYNERIRVDGEAADDACIRAAFAAVEAAREGVPLTYFEFTTVAALLIFGRADLDVAILEVGLGGRLDAVNIVDADVALITAIGIDHEDWLGSTREHIGLEKAGIMRPGRPVVCSDHDVPATVVEHARTLGAPLSLLGVDYAFESDGAGWSWWSGGTVRAALPHPALSGMHQLRNAAGALQVVNLLHGRLPVAERDVRRGLAEVVLHGRFQRIDDRFQYVMDVAHNPQAAQILAGTLRALPGGGRTHGLIGMLRTKNHVEFLRPLLPLVDAWHFADLPGAAGADAADLAAALVRLDARAAPVCHAGVEQAHAAIAAGARSGDRILVAGSFLTVGAMLRVLDGRPG